jgi:FkbM family methyltransferase
MKGGTMTDKTELGGLFYPTKDQSGNEIPFDSLFIPYIYKEIYFEGVYIDILNGKSDLTIVDVGSNIGITVDHFRSYAKKVYAIEPSPEHFKALAKNKEFNNWDNVELFQYALSDKNGEMSFSQNKHNRTMNTLSEMGEFKVPTKTIDTFFEENNIDTVDFMKFDPEGEEDKILLSDGFKKVADRIKAIEVEFHKQNWTELVEYMISLGYQARRYEASAIIVLFFR